MACSCCFPSTLAKEEVRQATSYLQLRAQLLRRLCRQQGAADLQSTGSFSVTTGEVRPLAAAKSVSFSSLSGVSEAPASEDRVRLSRFAGSWTLTPVGEGQVRIQYLWQAEYGGSLPTWTLNTARKKTGAEAIKDLAKAAGGLDYRAP